MKLLHDLSTLPSPSSASTLDSPPLSELADLSPLPLPVVPLLKLGLLDVRADADESLRDAVSAIASTGGQASNDKSRQMAISMSDYLEVLSISVEICQAIHDAARMTDRPLNMIQVVQLLDARKSEADPVLFVGP